jgi:hypothetical protein
MSTWQDVIQRANTDPQFRNRLKANPAAAAKDAGVEVPAGADIDVVEDRTDELHVFLNSRPQTAELKAIVERAREDADYKARLLAEPRRVVESSISGRLPPTIQVRVHDPQPGQILLVLSQPSSTDSELSDAELDAVAGGGKVGDFLRRVGTGIVNAVCPNYTADEHTPIYDDSGKVVAVRAETDYSLGGYETVYI